MDLLLWQKIPIRATRPGATPARHSTDALAPAAAALADRAGAAAAPARRIASTAPPLPPRRPAALPAAPTLFCESAAMSAAPEYSRPRVCRTHPHAHHHHHARLDLSYPLAPKKSNKFVESPIYEYIFNINTKNCFYETFFLRLLRS